MSMSLGRESKKSKTKQRVVAQWLVLLDPCQHLLVGSSLGILDTGLGVLADHSKAYS